MHSQLQGTCVFNVRRGRQRLGGLCGGVLTSESLRGLYHKNVGGGCGVVERVERVACV